jgi:hypothetical protein
MTYVRDSFRFARLFFGEGNSFNLALAKLKREVARGENRGVMPAQAELGFAVWLGARECAAERGAEATAKEDIACGRERAAFRLQARRRRPSDDMLKFHVKALMAVVQEATGLPVHATRIKQNSYEPQGTDRLGEMVIWYFQQIDPTIQETTIVNIILNARKEYRDRPMPFRKFCPGYGMKVTPF